MPISPTLKALRIGRPLWLVCRNCLPLWVYADTNTTFPSSSARIYLAGHAVKRVRIDENHSKPRWAAPHRHCEEAKPTKQSSPRVAAIWIASRVADARGRNDGNL